MHELAQANRRERLIHLANLLAAHERATPLARRVLECRVSLLEAALIAAPEDEKEGDVHFGGNVGLAGAHRIDCVGKP